MPTPTLYTFTQEVDYTSLLTVDIQQSTISTALDHIDTEGTGPSMSVSVWFKDVLSSADQSTLTSVMSSYQNVAPLPLTPKVMQVLNSVPVNICPFGVMFDAPGSQVTTYDMPFSVTTYLKGGIMYSSPGSVGDMVTIQVVDKDNVTGQGGNPSSPTVLATYVNGWCVIPQTPNEVEDVSITQPMPAGLYVRVIYTNSTATDCKVIVNFLAYQGVS